MAATLSRSFWKLAWSDDPGLWPMRSADGVCSTRTRLEPIQLADIWVMENSSSGVRHCDTSELIEIRKRCEDEIHVPLGIPARLILAPSVQRVQNRIARLRVGPIIWRCVDEAAAPFAGDFGKIPLLADVNMRNIFGPVVMASASGISIPLFSHPDPKKVMVAGSATVAPSI